MPALKQAISKTAKRLLLQRAIHRAGAGLTLGLALGCAALLADRLLRLELPIESYLALAGLGLMAGLAAGVVHRPDAQALALRLDRAFRLKDRLATAAALAESAPAIRQDPAFAAWVQRDADRLAERIDVRPVTPLRISGIWGGALALAILLWAGVLFLPARSADAVAGGGDRAGALRDEPLREEVASTVQRAVAELREDPDLTSAAGEDLPALEDLAEQLTAPHSDPSTARDESTARLTEIADRLARQAERDAAASEELARRFRELSPPEAPMSAEQFSEALHRGELGNAAKLLDELLDDAQTMSEQERQAAAGHLRALSEQLGELADDEPISGEERRAQLEQALRDQGLTDEQVAELMDDPAARDEEDVRQSLEQENVDEEIAGQLARDLQRLQQEQQRQEQARRDSTEMSQAMREAADAVERPEPRAAPGADEQTERETAARRESGDRDVRERDVSEPSGSQEQVAGAEQREQQQATEAGERQQQTEAREGEPQAEPRSSEQTEAAEAQRQGQRSEETPAGERGPAEERPPSEQPEPQPSPDVEQERRAREAEGESPREADPESEQRSEQQRSSEGRSDEQQVTPPDQPSSPEQQQEQGERVLQEAPEGTAAQQQARRQEAEGEPGEQGVAPSQQDQNAERPDAQQLLREFERRRNSAPKQREAADRFRRMARELSDDMSEEDRQRWAQQWQRERGEERGGGIGEAPAAPLPQGRPSPAPETIEEIELTGDDVGDETLLEWLTDGSPGAAEGPRRSEGAGTRVHRAQEAAERAVNEATVPPRYHEFIRRYFDRLDETVGRASGGSTPAAEDDSGDGSS